MHTILGANGIIGEELAKSLRAEYHEDVRLVGRRPEAVHPGDELFVADLLDADRVRAAVRNTDVAYVTAGLPYRSAVWLRDWEIMLRNVIAACRTEKCKLVYFDNTYAYPQDSTVQTEDTPLAPNGAKGRGKKIAAELLLRAMETEEVEAVICRAPEFYGPGKTKGITNNLVFANIKAGRKARVFLRDDVLRTLIYTPDASRSMALIAHTPDAFGQTWHLPCDDQRLAYREFIAEISRQLGRDIDYAVMPNFLLRLVALFNADLKETLELLPRYAIDNVFESKKFQLRFPEFRITTYTEGIAAIIEDMGLR